MMVKVATIKRRKLSGRRPLNPSSAEFDLRSIVKQFLLLEDHCRGGTRANLKAIEGYLNEIMNLAESSINKEPNGIWATESKVIYKKSARWLNRLMAGRSPAVVCVEVRLVRKDLMAKVYDPRG